MDAAPAAIPVTVLTGFLGAGKTTVLNHLLKNKPQNANLAVINNEFALEIGLEKELTHVPHDLEEHYHEVFEFGSGCLCCNSRDELEHIVLETTGLADPIFIQSLFLVEEFRQALSLDAVVTVVDAKHLALHLYGSDGKEAMEQLIFADRVLLNKIDSVTPKELEEVESVVKKYNSRASIIKCTWGAVEPSQLLGLRAFSADNLPAERAAKLSERAVSNAHSNTVSAFLLLGRGSTSLSQAEFSAWLSDLLNTYGASVFRLKGIANFASEPAHSYILQGVHKDCTINRLHTTSDKLVKLLLIGKDLPRDALLREFRKVMPQAQLMS